MDGKKIAELLKEEEDRYKNFMSSVAGALQCCQELEFELKKYLEACYELIRIKLDSSIPCKINHKDFEKDALGTLINKFSKFSDDDQLVNDLKDFTNERNFLTHQAIAQSYTPGGDFAPDWQSSVTARIPRIEETARSLHTRVYMSSQTLLCTIFEYHCRDEED